MRVLSVLAAAAVLVAAPLAAPAGAAVTTPPGITVLSVTGSGCPAGTAAAALSADRTALTVTYSDYVVVAGGSTRPVSRTCRIDLRIDPVPGYAPTVTSLDNRGFADLAAGSRALLTNIYGFRGARTRVAVGWLAGPYADNWITTDASGGGLVSGSCRGSHVLDLDSTLTLVSSRAGAATDQVTVDSTDVVAPSTFRLAWKRC
jgi:hypothetical protein